MKISNIKILNMWLSLSAGVIGEPPKIQINKNPPSETVSSTHSTLLTTKNRVQARPHTQLRKKKKKIDQSRIKKGESGKQNAIEILYKKCTYIRASTQVSISLSHGMAHSVLLRNHVPHSRGIPCLLEEVSNGDYLGKRTVERKKPSYMNVM